MRVSAVSVMSVALLALAGSMAMSVALAEDESPRVTAGREVSLEYTLTLDDGSLADSNVGAEPFVYVHGQQQLLLALERELEGLSAGEVKEVHISADDGYGPVEEELIQEVDAQMIPEEARQVGEMLVGHDDEGRPFQVRVAEVRDDTVVVDFNHPLAGEGLNFEVKVLAVR